MKFKNCTSHFVLIAAMSGAMLSAQTAHSQAGQSVPGEEMQSESGKYELDNIIVTAQRRSTTVQDTSAAISAFSGANLEEERILSFEDLAGSATSLSFTALSPLDQEFNIRGITNTRLDSPSADQSIGIFSDDVYVGRSGLFNFDLYDIGRVEVVRGPQGVLLGRNVVGGAISIYSAEPEFDPNGRLSVSYGNYNEILANGHITGAITDDLAGRFSFQVRNRDGFNQDIMHNVDLDNVDSSQFRGQLLYMPENSQFSAKLSMDYTKDTSNGFHSVAVDDPFAGQGGWSLAREQVGVVRGEALDIRESLPEWPRYKGDAQETPQQLNREAYGITLKMENEFDFATLTSITGYRKGDAHNLYDQTGIGPDNIYDVVVLSPPAFTSGVNETEDIKQFSQELRLVSAPVDQGFDWIVGAYLQNDKVKKFDRFWAQTPIPIPTLSGESTWDNESKNESYAAFAQLGYRFNDKFRIVGGLRYTEDKKGGSVTGTAVEGGDQFFPDDQVALTPLSGVFLEGDSYTTDYSNKWTQFTPQFTAEFEPNDDMLLYATYSIGYKGGGFEDDPANATAAQTSYDPETVDNIEIGGKFDFFNNRARLNVAAFFMKYKDLQVTQTNADCLCNITDNAADADIKGIELEGEFVVAEGLTLSGGLTYLDTEYIDFVDSLGRDSSGNFLQRTPEYQFNVSANYETDLGEWRNGFKANVSYSHQGKLFWAPENVNYEDAYGTLNGRVSITPNEGDLTVSLWGRNLTDKLYRTNVIAFFGDEISRLAAPRTYGASVAVKF
ncbi:iron complex outermembrane receptor protein [Litorimonas taeanensis]|uniref:Iron complex outermembrane receptor protein n=1 Tax=Litorimonas taeanensis TaxID=568099 RepID=A0A420WMS0_9PROT|nr:TonB-dependent receptor [Litorimonas taeanensis]RKQ72196.1 iron complex outermembrane receptor protein [Litorimonas taeanensis]